MIKEGQENTFDKFELIAAVVLGLAAIGTALAGFQSGLWGGKSVEEYGKANTIATKAASERSRAVVEMSRDTSIDIEAYRQILEAEDASNEADKKRAHYIATYLYISRMSDEGYKALGLSPDTKKKFNELEELPETEEGDPKQFTMQEDVLDVVMEKELAEDENYRKEMLAESVKLTEESEKIFKEGQDANEIGDKFDFANVLFAISLFFVGISLIFKTSIRWVLLGLGSLCFVSATIYMLTLSWTSF